MPRNREWFETKDAHPPDIGGIDRYVICAVKNDETIVPVVWHRTNGSAIYMTYKSISGARDGHRRVTNTASHDFWQTIDEIVILDRHERVYQNIDGIKVEDAIAAGGADNGEPESEEVPDTEEVREGLVKLTEAMDLARKLLDFINTNEANFSIGNDDSGGWSAMMAWGQEAEDSPMAAAAAHGSGENIEACIRSLLIDAGVDPDGED